MSAMVYTRIVMCVPFGCVSKCSMPVCVTLMHKTKGLAVQAVCYSDITGAILIVVLGDDVEMHVRHKLASVCMCLC